MDEGPASGVLPQWPVVTETSIPLCQNAKIVPSMSAVTVQGCLYINKISCVQLTITKMVLGLKL